MTEFEKLCAKQREIILKGPKSIRRTLHEGSDAEVEALLFCLEEYLDPYYNRRLPYEAEIRSILIDYSNSGSASDNAEEARRMIEEYLPGNRGILARIIYDVLYKGLSGSELENTLIESFHPEGIYESEDLLVTDAYLSLIHYASGEERIPDAEWKYLLECLIGSRNYELDEKIQLTEDAES